MKQTAKKLLSTVLALAMVLSLLPAALITPAQAAGDASSSSTNEFGFKTDVPEDFDAEDGKHPFGSQGSDDRVNLMPVNEIGVMETDGSSNYTKILDNMSTTLFSYSPSTDKFLYVNGVAYDPTGSGRDDHVFYYGPVQGNTNIVSMQDYSYENGTAGTVHTRNLSASSGNDYAYSWMTEARPYNAEGYLPIAAGDFNGDGKETVVLLDPEYTKLCLREYTIKEGYGLDYISSYDIGNNVSYSKGTLNTIQNFDSGSDKNKKARNTPSIHLTAGDLDGDGVDELVVTVSLGDMYKEGGTWDRGSKVLVLEQSGTSWTQKSSRQFDSVGDGKVLRAAASVVGDIDSDGTNEIITVGVGSNDHEDNDDYEFGDYYCILMKYSNGSLSQRGSCTLTRKTTSREKDTVEYMAPLSVGLVHFNGVGTTPFLLVRGEVYQYNSGIYERYGADTNMLGSQKIVRQPIVGNFDGNNRGQEQVLFVMATGTGTPTIGCYYNSNTNGMLSLSSRTYSTRGSNAGRVALTAADADTNDGMVAKFESKTYEYVDPEVMAVLLATPYFEDLYDEYENLGATGFGKATGTETAASSGATNRAGAYVSFEQDISLLGMMDVASVEFETAYEYEWSTSVEMSTSYETSIEYEAGSGSNQVVMICTPVIVYHYSILDQNGGSLTPMDISVAQEPSYSIISLEDYNEIAERLGKATVDNSSVTSVEPGQPLSYPKTAAEIDCVSGTVATTGSTVTAQYSNAIVGQSIDQSEGSTVTKEYSHSIDAKAGGGALGFKVGGTYGHTWSSGTSVTTTSGVTRSGSVANIPAGNTDYSLTWQFATWDITIGEGQNQYTVPVMGYLVPSAHQPPSVPVDLTATPYTTSVTLNWQPGYASAAKYEIYRYIPGDTAKQYYLVGTVDGSATSFTCEGLDPATRYYFSIRAVDENGLCSRYSEPVMVTTSSKQGLPKITIQPTDQSVPVGETVTFSTEAIPAVSTGLIGYTWQSRENSRSAWKTIEGAMTSRLTLSKVTEDMDGTQYRCMISELGGGENPSFVYTDTATLTVGKYDTTTQLSLSQNSGSADYTETVAMPSGYEDVTIEIGGTTYTKYNNIYDRTKNTIEFVYGSNTGDYCLYDGTTQTPLTALGNWVVNEDGHVVATRDMEQKTEKVYASAGASESVECPVYTATVYTVTEVAEGEGTTYELTGQRTETLYAYTPTGGTLGYYLGTASGGRIILDDSPLTATASDTGFTAAGTYYLSSSLSPVDADIPVTEIADTGTTIPGTDKDGNSVNVPVYATYNVYTLSSDGSKIYEKDGMFYTKSGDVFTAVTNAVYYGTSGLYGTVSADQTTITNMVQVGSAETREKNVYSYTSHSGEPVTLTATVETVSSTPGSGKVTFQITNTATGAVTTLTANADSTGKATVTWTPSAAGVYTIKAVYSGNSTMKPSSSGSVTYYALKSKTADSCYEILLSGELLYGNTITPSLQQWSSTGTTPVGQSATFKLYRHNGTAFVEADANWTSGILNPGEYRVDAVRDNHVVAQKVFTVSKRPITISAPELDTISAGTNPDLSGNVAKIAYKNADGTAYALEEAYRQLFTLTGVSSNPPSGNYDISVVYKNAGSATAADFRSKYQPTFEKSILTVEAGMVTIEFSAGENGTVTGYEIGEATTTTISSPRAIATGSTVRFVPKATTEGFLFSKWLLIDTKGSETIITQESISNGAFNAYGTFSLDSDGGLRVENIRQPMKLKVEFTNATHRVTFSSGEHGSIKAVQGNTTLTSPSTLVEGSSVSFIATPDSGYVVKQWSVAKNNGTADVQLNPDGETAYTGTTLTLDDINTDYTVRAEFEPAGRPLAVTYSAVDANGNATADGLVTFTADGLDENGQAQKGSTVTLTAETAPGTGIQRWEISTDGGTTWETKAGSTTEYTIYSLQANTLVRVVVRTSTATYTVSYSIDGKKGSDTSAGTLTAKTGGTPVSSGASCIAYSSLVFTYVESEDYEFVRWDVTGTQGTDSSNGTTHTCTISSLDNDTTVKAVVRKKPLISVDSAVNGAVTVTKSGTDTVIVSGTYVYSGTQITVTAAPDLNYEVTSFTVGGTNVLNNTAAAANSDDRIYTSPDGSGIVGDTTIKVTFSKIPSATVTYSVVDKNGAETDGGLDGALKMSVTRKNMDGYASTYPDKGTNTAVSATVYRDSTVTFTAVPDSGYRVKEWRVNGQVQLADGITNTSNTLELNDLRDNAEITVQFTYQGSKVIASAGENGALTKAMVNGSNELTSISHEGVILNKGVSVTFTAEPSQGYEVESWVVNGIAVAGETGTTYTYVADGNGAVIAVTFRPVAYAVSWSGEKNGTVSAAGYDGVSASIRGGTEVIFTAEPENGYVLAGWKVNGETQSGQVGSTFTWTVPAGAEKSTKYKIEAVFTTGAYSVTVTDPDHGTISAKPDVTNGVTGGTSVTFTASAEEGYMVVGWTVNGTTTDTRSTTHTVTITSDTAVTAVVVPSQYNVTYGVNDSTGGTLSADGCSESPATVPYGGSVTFTATPDTGAYYYIQAWQVDGQTVTNDTEGVTISADKTTLTLSNVTSVHTVEAVFAKTTAYSVGYRVIGAGGSLGAAVNGEPLTLTPSQSADVWGNSKLVFTASPDKGFMVKEWKINGEPQENLSNTLTIDTLHENILVTVEYETARMHSIPNPGPDEGYTVEKIIKNPVDYGTEYEIRDRGTVTFTVVPAEGKNITTLTCGDGTVIRNDGGSDTVTVENVQRDIELDVTVVDGIPLTIQCGENGALTVKRNEEDLTTGAALQVGDVLTIKGVPDSGYRLSSLTVNDAAISSGSSYTVTEDDTALTIAATFTKVTPPAGGGGGGTAAPAETVIIKDSVNGKVTADNTYAEKGNTVTLTVTPDKGYTLEALTVTDTGGKEIKPTEKDGKYTFAMPASKVTVTATFMEDNSMLNFFVDVFPDDYYYDAVLWAAENDITSGVDSTHFAPSSSCTRAQAVTFLWRAAGCPAPQSSDMPFTDVAADSYYYNAVLWAVENGITKGTSDTAFSPNATCTRGHIVTFLWRSQNTPAAGADNPFTDVTADAYYADAVLWAVENGITTGTTETTFSPDSNCTRAQIVTFLYRCLGE